jgi:hypothetical protein
MPLKNLTRLPIDMDARGGKLDRHIGQARRQATMASVVGLRCTFMAIADVVKKLREVHRFVKRQGRLEVRQALSIGLTSVRGARGLSAHSAICRARPGSGHAREARH